MTGLARRRFSYSERQRRQRERKMSPGDHGPLLVKIRGAFRMQHRSGPSHNQLLLLLDLVIILIHGCRVSWNEQRISRQLKLRDLHVLMTVATVRQHGQGSQPALGVPARHIEGHRRYGNSARGQAAGSQPARRRADDLRARAAGAWSRRLRRIEARHRARQFPGKSRNRRIADRKHHRNCHGLPSRRRRSPVTEISARGLSFVSRRGGDDVPYPGGTHG